MSEQAFIPKDGQIDYTNIRYCPVVNIVVTKDGMVLLVQRSKELRLYPGLWNGVSGFLDDQASVEEKVKEELGEELDIGLKDIVSIKRGPPLLQEAPEYNKTWLVVPVLVTVKTEKFTLDREAQTARWFKPRAVAPLKLLPGFDAVLKTFF